MHADDDGRRDFDFLHGTWDVSHRRLIDRLDPECGEWQTFAGTGRAEPILGGLGNADRLWVPDLPGEGAFEGHTVRLFDPASRAWRIWWASTARPGILDPPLEGRFADGAGSFGDADDTVDGVAIKVRFTWSEITDASARWQQAFSFDAGATWRPNWTMDFTRTQA